VSSVEVGKAASIVEGFAIGRLDNVCRGPCPLGRQPGKRTSFTDGLRAKGFTSEHTRIGTTFSGIRVTPHMTECDR
jgi:hypothetical protein